MSEGGVDSLRNDARAKRERMRRVREYPGSLSMDKSEERKKSESRD